MTLYKTVMSKLEALKIPEPLRRPVLIGWTLAQDLIRCDLTRHASAMAYVSLLSLIPSLVAVFCILSLFAPLVGKGVDFMELARQFILDNLASGSGDTAVAYLNNMLTGLNLSTIGLGSFASVLVTLIMLLRQIEGALNRIWLVHKGRNAFTRFMYFWTFLTLGVVVIGVVIGVTAGSSLKQLMSFQTQVVTDDGFFSTAIGYLSGVVFFFFLYKVVPNCRVRSKHAVVGAMISAFLLTQAGRYYGMYVIGSKSYQTLYGALAQLPLFLMWLYICWIIILLGALISWRMQEGFPKASDDDKSLDAAESPIDQLRNAQVKAMLPMLALLSIYRTFQQGTGKGISAQDLAERSKLPASWVAEALEALATMGYVVATRPPGAESDGASVIDPYFPTKPAETLELDRLNADLSRPLDAWMSGWHHELPLDVPKAMRVLGGAARDGLRQGATLAEALRMIPAHA